MQKSVVFLILLLILALAFPFAGQSTAAGSSSSEITILTSDYKYSPEETRVSEVRQQIVASYVPAQKETPVLLDRSPDIKKKVVHHVKISDSSFRRKLSARSAIVIDAETGEELYSQHH
jgi:D-alanyl-D-alanine carboxypeptidase